MERQAKWGLMGSNRDELSNKIGWEDGLEPSRNEPRPKQAI